MVHSLKLRNQMQHSLSQGRRQCMLSPIGLIVFSRLVMGLSAKRVIIVFKNLCCERPLGGISQDHRYTRCSTLWSGLLPSSFCLQYLRILNHWAICCCFTELLGDAPLSPFHHQLDLFLHSSAHWNIRRD
ncbi:hypothetical protein H5410_031978 [Solanum commersonii]|uniref:Uncharacterized protein n=1 Tax=Solanum commersonii TaxID=4109 RepID=A0A9J5YLP4_SOLCO|nr:hypothetical protein H5410_031978 [Solanum commersonii]